jgi:transcriptional regulator with XRE-family HTH domain
MPKAQDDKKFNSVAEFMEATGMSDTELAEYLDVDRSEAVRLRHGRTFRSLVKPLKIAKKCKVPIERLAPSTAA